MLYIYIHIHTHTNVYIHTPADTINIYVYQSQMYSNFPRIVGAAACGVAQRVADRRLGQRSLQQRRRGEAAVGGAQLTSLKVKMDLFLFVGGM